LIGGIMAAAFAALEEGEDVLDDVDRGISQLDKAGFGVSTPWPAALCVGVEVLRSGIKEYGQQRPAAGEP
jgi:hypothetical protein